MARRTVRTAPVHGMISPLRSRARRILPRLHRGFPRVQPRWTIAQRLARSAAPWRKPKVN